MISRMILVYALLLTLVAIVSSIDFSKYTLDEKTKSLLYCDDNYVPQEKPQQVKEDKAEFSNVNDDRSAEEAEDLLIRIYGDKR